MAVTQNTSEWVASTIKFIFPQFWRLEVHHYVVGRFGFFRHLSHGLTEGCLFITPSHGLASVRCVSRVFAFTFHFLKGHPSVGIRVYSNGLYLIYFFKDSSSKDNQIWRHLLVRALFNIRILEGHNSAYNTYFLDYFHFFPVVQ